VSRLAPASKVFAVVPQKIVPINTHKHTHTPNTWLTNSIIIHAAEQASTMA